MNKIMKEYKVDEVTELAQGKIQNKYLSEQLPETRSELEKAIRMMQKNEDLFLKFVYRFDSDYLQKINPTFDMMHKLVNVIIKRGEGQEATRFM